MQNYIKVPKRYEAPLTLNKTCYSPMETVRDFIFLGLKITADGDCSHEIKRCLLLGRKAVTNLDSILKSRDITLLTKVHKVKSMRELTHWKRPWCWERLKVEEEGDDREWDGWIASMTQWTWVWASFDGGEGQGSLVCCSPFGHKESDMTEGLNNK